MKSVRRTGAVLISAALAFLINGTLAHAQGRGGNAPAEPPTLKGKVAAYEADTSITLETKVRGGQVNKTEFSIVKGTTKIELGAGVKAIEPGMTVSVWAEKDNPKNAARIVVEPEAPTVKGKVVAYEADKSITVETPVRGGGVKTSEFSIIKDKTQIELGAGLKAIEVGMTVSVWAEKDNSKNAARIAAQGAAPGRGRGSAGAVPPDKGENPKPAAPAAPPAPRTGESADVKKVLDAKDLGKLLELIKPAGEHELRWMGIPWMTDVAKARQKAADEGKMLIHWSCTHHPLGAS